MIDKYDFIPYNSYQTLEERFIVKAKVAERGQVTIPKILRERLGIRPGTMLDFSAENGRLVAVKFESVPAVDQIYGKFGRGRSTDTILAELRGEK